MNIRIYGGRHTRLNLRLNETEYRYIVEAAAKSNLMPGTFVRVVALKAALRLVGNRTAGGRS
jgi:uncharacterized protein (DUF1778 family)